MNIPRLFARRTAAAPAPKRDAAPSKTKSRLVAGTAIAALAVATVGGYEGLRTKAYVPIPGDVPTVCFGETRGVKLGDVHTVEECRAMLGVALVEFEAGMRECLSSPDAIPDESYVALLSLSYNVGLGAFCKSTIARKVNAGDLAGACEGFRAWNRAGGRVVPGLSRRRAEERTLCLKGLAG